MRRVAVNAIAARGAIAGVVGCGREGGRERRPVMIDERKLARAAAEWHC